MITRHHVSRTSTRKPLLTCSTAHAEFAQTNCTQPQPTNKSEILYPEPTELADFKQQKDGPPSKKTRSKCPLTPSAHNQPSRHTHHSGAHLTQQLPHIDTHSKHQQVQQYDGPPSYRTRSQYNSNCKTCTDHTAFHQTPFIPPAQHLPLSAPADHPNLSCNLQSNTFKQKRRRILQLNTLIWNA